MSRPPALDCRADPTPERQSPFFVDAGVDHHLPSRLRRNDREAATDPTAGRSVLRVPGLPDMAPEAQLVVVEAEVHAMGVVEIGSQLGQRRDALAGKRHHGQLTVIRGMEHDVPAQV